MRSNAFNLYALAGCVSYGHETLNACSASIPGFGHLVSHANVDD
jgi:hypothetical protein